MEFSRTRRAAEAEKTTKWDLIAAIADDAVENGLPITGMASQTAAMSALEQAGSDYAAGTIPKLCHIAKFDHESTAKQRRLWRTYGWSVVHRFVQAGYTPEAVAAYLSERRRSQRDVEAFIRSTNATDSTGKQPEPSIDDAWREWLNRAHRLLADGATLAERSDGMTELGTHAALAQLIYQRMTEHQLDAEIRQLFDGAGIEA